MITAVYINPHTITRDLFPALFSRPTQYTHFCVSVFVVLSDRPMGWVFKYLGAHHTTLTSYCRLSRIVYNCFTSDSMSSVAIVNLGVSLPHWGGTCSAHHTVKRIVHYEKSSDYGMGLTAPIILLII